MKNSTLCALSDIVGKPWVSGASGPDAYDCWGVYEYYMKLSGMNGESFDDIDHENRKQVLNKISTEKDSEKWVPVDYPIDGDLVLMYEGERCYHVGLYIKRQVLHSMKARKGFVGGVCLHNRSIINTLFKKLEFYRPA